MRLSQNTRELIDKIKEAEANINQLKKELESLQEVIDEIFIKYQVKSLEEKEKMSLKYFKQI